MSLFRRYRVRNGTGGFLLPLALVFLFILLSLEIGLYTMQQRAAQNVLDESSRLAHLLGQENVEAELTESLAGGQSASISVNSDINYPVEQSQLKLTASWGDKDSFHRPIPKLWSDYESILKRETPLPFFSYSEDAQKSNLPLGHTRLELHSSFSGQRTSVTTWSNYYPFGLYAPQGKIVAGSISSFTNPVEYTDKDKKAPLLETGRPVHLWAQSDITVENAYGSGLALSQSGSVTLPSDNQGAVGLSGLKAPPSVWSKLQQELDDQVDTIGSAALNKTEFFDDQLFTIDHLKKIFGGKTEDLLSIFSVGQACKVPFFPIPAIQDDAPFMIVFYLMHPYPVDFSGVARDGEKSKRLKEVTEELEQAKKDKKDKEKELAEEQSKSKPDKKKVDRLKGEISDLEDKIESLKSEAKKISKEISDEADDMAGQISQAKIPQTAAEDAEQVTDGWAYFYILGELFNIVKDLLSGDDPFKDIFVATRVVHLGDQGPDWEWSADEINLKANLTVPRGRTLRLEKPDIIVRGDIFLQQGATLKIDGNLEVRRPDSWTDFAGAEASDYGGYPIGRIIISEGASLIVDGDLVVSGGSFDLGSVMVSSAYGDPKALTRFIHATGDITIKHGIAPSVSFGDLVEELAKDNPGLKDFNEHFFQPLTEQVFVIVGRLPGVGPWQWRKCWFAKYATTFEFIPALEEFGLGGPWPIPLPFDNCLTKVFDYMSIIYAVELNALTGENLYTHSPFWVFGRGVSPILLKVNPKLVGKDLEDLKWEKITLSSLEEEAKEFLVEALPKFAANVIQDVITTVIEKAVESLIPFKPPTCGSTKNEEAETIKQTVKKFLKDKLKEFGGIAKIALKRTLLRMKNEVYSELESSDPEYAIKRQLPGVLISSGGKMTIGEEGGARMALGLFLAKDDLTIECQDTIGVAVSLEGDIEVKNLLHYPFYDRISLYQAKVESNIFESLGQFGDPKGVCVGDIGQLFPHRLAEGWK